MTGQLRVNGKLWHLQRCTLDGWSLAVLILHLHVRLISFSNTKKYIQLKRVLVLEVSNIYVLLADCIEMLFQGRCSVNFHSDLLFIN